MEYIMSGMNVKVDEVLEKLNRLLKLNSNSTGSQKTSEEEEEVDALVNSITFPIKSHENLMKLDELLSNQRVKKKLVNKLYIKINFSYACMYFVLGVSGNSKLRFQNFI